MKQIGMEKEGGAGLHLDIDEVEICQDFLHSCLVGSRLFAGQYMIDPAEFMRAADYLKASVFSRRRINCDVHAGEQRKEHSVLVPVSVVLMPGPGAPDLGIFHDHLGVIV